MIKLGKVSEATRFEKDTVEEEFVGVPQYSF